MTAGSAKPSSATMKTGRPAATAARATWPGKGPPPAMMPRGLRSFAVAAGFGLASTLSVIVLGDESGYTTGEVQKVKLAAIEAEWETAKPPASFTLFGFPNQKEERTDYAVKIPWAMGLIATRSIDTPVIGLTQLRDEHKDNIKRGMLAFAALEKLRGGDTSPEVKAEFEKYKDDLGYGLLLKKYTPNVVDATPEATDAAPPPPPAAGEIRRGHLRLVK